MISKSANRSIWRRRIAIAKQSSLLSVIVWSASLALYGQSLQSSGTSVTIHTEDARATLLALQNPSLTLEEAQSIAAMHGNQGVIRKLQEFRVASTTESFASALLAIAHGTRVTSVPEVALGLDRAKQKSQKLITLLNEIQMDPKRFQGAIEDRIRLFTPANAGLHLEGYIVAAGDGAGYTFGGTDFFLNIGLADDMSVARSTTTHELYHAVQAAYAADRQRIFRETPGVAQVVCTEEERLFASLYEEGTARFVEDTSLLSQSKSEAAAQILTDFREGVGQVHNGTILLDMSLDALEARNRLSFDDIYPIGFLGHGALYGVGYVMARDLANDSGRQAIIDLLREPPETFVLRYTQLAKYGIDDDHPALGKSTVAAARRLADACR